MGAVQEEHVDTVSANTISEEVSEANSAKSAPGFEDETYSSQQVNGSEPPDPEAPPWNFLFVFPLAIFVLLLIFGVLIAFK